MEKPVTMRIQEFDENICSTINNCGLPMWKICDELEKIMMQVRNACLQEKEAERKEYEKELEKEKLETKRTERKEQKEENGGCQ